MITKKNKPNCSKRPVHRSLPALWPDHRSLGVDGSPGEGGSPAKMEPNLRHRIDIKSKSPNLYHTYALFLQLLTKYLMLISLSWRCKENMEFPTQIKWKKMTQSRI